MYVYILLLLLKKNKRNNSIIYLKLNTYKVPKYILFVAFRGNRGNTLGVLRDGLDGDGH